ncbi:MAG TPA: tetratricopeptide repeat protein [Blastocatellia bacterium]|nr:tetratricopeptide repeat protein [Blastocatellia bacterium]
MTIEFNLKNIATKLVVVVLALVAFALLVILIASRFIVGTLSDDRFIYGRETLVVPLEYFPNSARLNARLAEAELLESDRDLARAEQLALRAINLSPFNYRYQLTLASIKEAQGDRTTAEEALRSAIALAPNDRNVHWRLANVLLRQGKLAASVDEFRIVTDADIHLLPVTLDLIWRASRGSVEAVEAVAGNDAKARLPLAQFLVRQSKFAEAANVFRSIDRNARLASMESAGLLNSLVAADNLALARDLWVSLIAEGNASAQLVWNGGFESDILKNFSQFDWTFGRSEYARLTIDTSRPHSGSRSLKMEFLGRDTTELKDEIRQLVIVRPGARYRVECYVKSENLVTPDGPRLVVTDRGSTWIAQSDPVVAGSNDWKLLSVEFVAPKAVGDSSAVYISMKRKSKYGYDEPTRGAIWLDDFTMKEQ